MIEELTSPHHNPVPHGLADSCSVSSRANDGAAFFMKLLPACFTSKGFTHRLLKRVGDIAIFERFKTNPDKAHFEVVRIQSHDGRSIAGKFFPSSEFYPSTSQWGTHGFTYTQEQSGGRDKALQDAENRFSKLLHP